MTTNMNKLEFLEKKINNYPLIERKLIKLLFATDSTLRKLKENPELINSSLFIDSDVTMLGLDKLGNKMKCSTADGLEISKNKGVLLIEAKDITNALVERLGSFINNSVKGIVDRRVKEVKKKLDGSVNLLNRLLQPINKTLEENTNIWLKQTTNYFDENL